MHKAISRQTYDEHRSALVKRWTVEDCPEQALLALEELKLIANTNLNSYHGEFARLFDEAKYVNDVSKIGKLRKNAKFRGLIVHAALWKLRLYRAFCVERDG